MMTLGQPAHGKADVIRVSSTSHPKVTAGTIAAIMRDHGIVEIQAIGAGAITQTVKSLVIAQGYLLKDRIHLTWTSELVDVTIEAYEWTAMRFTVRRQLGT